MKHLFTFLLMVVGVWSSLGQCTYYMDMNDSFGDGWNGASLDVSINGAPPTNFTLPTGSARTDSIQANNGDVVTFTYNSGIFDSEVTYTIRRGGTSLFNDGPNPFIGLAYTNTCGGCDPVGNLTATSVTSTNAAINWAASPSGGTSWIVEYGLTNFPVGTGTLIASAVNPTTITGLTPATTYDAYVYNICPSGDTSLAAGPVTFATACNVITTYPYQEGFNSNSTTQNCWTVLNQNGDFDTWNMDWAFNPFEGDEVAVINTDFNSGNNSDFLISPQLTLTGGERLRFKHRCNSTFEPNDYRVVLSTTGRDAVDFTTILFSDTSDATVYEEVVINLTGITGTAYIAFEIPPGGLDGWILYIDDVIFERPTQNDAGVTALINPTAPVSTGFTPVEVEVTNYGLQNLNSFMVEWEIGGVPQTPVPYSGNPLVNGETAVVSLGNLNVPASNLDMIFWTSMPNGVMDEETNNDTLDVTLCSGLAGVYTVGHPTADFPTVTEAFDALENCGVTGAVTLQFQPNTYTGPWKIGRIPGSNANNTVTFDGLDRTMATLTHNSLTEGAATLVLDGANYVTVRNFTIENTGTVDAYGVLLTNEANYNTIDNNNITMVVGTANNVVGVLASASTTQSVGAQTEGNNANWNVISNNNITGGRTSITLEGGVRGDQNRGNQIIGNELHDVDDYGIFADEQDSLLVEGNLIYDLNAFGSDAINLFDIVNSSVIKNEIRGSGDNGIGLFGSFNDPISNVLIANNLVEAGDEALLLSQVTSSQVYHNTFSGGNRTCSLSGQQNINFRSNIMATGSGTCFFTTSSVSMSAMDYNLYYVSGSGDVVGFGPTTYTTLANWQANGAAGYDANSVSGNPSFVNGVRISGALAVDAADPTLILTEDADGEARPRGAGPDIGADEFVVIANDAMALNLLSPQGCGSANADVIVEIANLGSNTIVNAPVSVRVSGAANSAFVATLPTVAPGARGQLNVGTLNTSAGGTYNFEVIVSLASDGNPSNDTLRTSVVINPDNQNALTFAGDNTVCAGSTAVVDATASYSPATIIWYDAPTGGNVVNVGNRFTTMPLTTNVTYYAAVQGCSSPRAARTVNVDNIGIDVDLGPDLTACGGTLVTITPNITNSTATRIQWQDGALTSTYDAGTTGDYYATVTNANGCTDTDTLTVTVSTAPTVTDNTTNVSCGSAGDG
ncbi:MAG: choice-of-anchor J domain-containing protein, partial [Aureispira sp.]